LLCFLLAGLGLLQSTAQGHLPEAPLPIRRPDLVETRTIKELRPGLTHIHIQRGGWGPEGPFKHSIHHSTEDQSESAKVRKRFEELGLEIRDISQTEAGAPPRYVLLAGNFAKQREALRIVYQSPFPVQLVPTGGQDIDLGPFAVDIVVLDPQKYRGKIVSAWSEKIWRVSPLELALRRNAVVATNGSWFHYSMGEIAGVPDGVSIVEGIWHHEPKPKDHNAPILFIENNPTQGPKLSVGYHDDLPPFPEVKWGDSKSIKLDGIDRFPDPNGNELVVVRQEIFWQSHLGHGYDETIYSTRLVGEITTENGYFLMATGSKKTF